MKTKQISTGLANLLLIELPEGTHGVRVFNDIDRPYISYFVGVETHRYYFEGKLWNVCFVNEMTEDIAKSLIEFFTTDEEFGKEDVFRDYKGKTFFDTALESWNSLLQANELLFKSPEKPANIIYQEDPIMYNRLEKAWERMQQNVWDKSRTYIFKEVK